MRGRHEYFDTEHLKEQLKGKAVSGGVSMMTAQAISFVLRTGSIVILARILMPQDFGLIAMVTAVTIIAENFKDLGLSTATVQSKKITHEQVSALFWVNVGFGTLAMFVIASLGWVIAWFFGIIVWLELRLPYHPLSFSVVWLFSIRLFFSARCAFGSWHGYRSLRMASSSRCECWAGLPGI